MRIRDIYRYAGTLYAANLGASALTFAVMILVSRAISKEALGAYGLFQAYFFILVALSGFGISQSLVKHIAERRIDLRELHSLLAVALILMSIVFVGVGALLVHYGRPILGWALIGIPPYHLFDYALSYSRGHLWRNRESLIYLGSSLATSLFIVFCIRFFPEEWGPIYGQVGSTYAVAFVLIALFFVHRRGHGESFRRMGKTWPRGFARIAAPLFLASGLYSLAEVADRFVIKHFLGLAVLGEYFLAMSLFGIIDKPIGLLSRVLLSHFAGARANDPAYRQAEATTRLIRLNLLLLPTFALCVVATLPLLLPYVLNKNFGPAFDVLAIASAVVAVKCVEVVNSPLAIANDSPMTNAYSQMGSLVIYVPVAALLAYYVGVLGVALAIVLRWLLFATYQLMHMRRRRVVTASGWLLMRGVAAYACAIAFFTRAPWAMVPVYLLAGVAFQLWSPKDAVRLLPMVRAAWSRR